MNDARLSADPVPAAQRRLGVHRIAPDMDLEMQVAADGAGVARGAYCADPLASEDLIAAVDGSRSSQMRVEIAAPLPFPMDEDVVAVEDRVVAGPPYAAAPNGQERCPAGGDDVEALVDPAAAARRPELADRPPRPMWSWNGEHVTMECRAAGACRQCQRGEDDSRAQVSTLKLRVAGDSSATLSALTARTLNLCLPGERPL